MQNTKTENVKMKMMFLGAIDDVTGSCTLLKYENGKKDTYLLIDCGDTQGIPRPEGLNYALNIADKIDFVLLTHAHFDHIGLLPELIEYKFAGKIICSKATGELTLALVEDSLNIKGESEKIETIIPKIKEKFIYFDDNKIVGKGMGYGTKGSWFSIADGIRISTIRSAHILGSTSYIISWAYNNYHITDEIAAPKFYSILFTGDLGPVAHNCDTSFILKDVQWPLFSPSNKITVCESTYGAVVREKYTVDQRCNELKKIIESAGSGKVLIPAFALSRFQEIAIDLFYIRNNLGFDRFNTSLDSPLANKINKIFDQNFYEFFKNEKCELKCKYMPKSFLNTFYPDIELNDSLDLCEKKEFFKNVYISKEYPTVVLASSGMCDNGSVLKHLPQVLKDPNSIIILTGFLAKGTIGRELKSFANLTPQELYNKSHLAIEIPCQDEKVTISYSDIKCKIYDFSKYYTGHIDQKGIINYLHGFDEEKTENKIENTFPTTVFLNHGERNARIGLKEKIEEANNDPRASQPHDISVILPKYKEWYVLSDFNKGLNVDIDINKKFKIGIEELDQDAIKLFTMQKTEEELEKEKLVKMINEISLGKDTIRFFIKQVRKYMRRINSVKIRKR